MKLIVFIFFLIAIDSTACSAIISGSFQKKVDPFEKINKDIAEQALMSQYLKDSIVKLQYSVAAQKEQDEADRKATITAVASAKAASDQANNAKTVADAAINEVAKLRSELKKQEEDIEKFQQSIAAQKLRDEVDRKTAEEALRTKAVAEAKQVADQALVVKIAADRVAANAKEAAKQTAGFAKSIYIDVEAAVKEVEDAVQKATFSHFDLVLAESTFSSTKLAAEKINADLAEAKLAVEKAKLVDSAAELLAKEKKALLQTVTANAKSAESSAMLATVYQVVAEQKAADAGIAAETAAKKATAAAECAESEEECK